MKGLLVKDILGIRRYLRTMGVLCAFFVVLSLLMHSATYISSMLSFLFLMMPLTVFSYDESAKWDAYGLTMPITRNQVVLGRYLLSLLMMVAGAVIGFAASSLLSLLPNMEGSMAEMALIIRVVCGMGMIFLSIVLPLIYKFGAEKGRYIMMAVLLGIFILFYLINSMNLMQWENQGTRTIFYLLPVLGLACLAVSYGIACRVYQNKEI